MSEQPDGQADARPAVSDDPPRQEPLLHSRRRALALRQAAQAIACRTAWQVEVRRLLNAERAGAGLWPLGTSLSLHLAAQGWSEEMARRLAMAHDFPDLSWRDLMRQAGYPPSLIGQNVAWGQPDPRAVIGAWMASAPHRANILSRSYKEVGVGAAQGGNGRWYWSENFGGADTENVRACATPELVECPRCGGSGRVPGARGAGR